MGPNGKYDGGYINYTAGVAPASDPQVALVVMVNNPKAGKRLWWLGGGAGIWQDYGPGAGAYEYLAGCPAVESGSGSQGLSGNYFSTTRRSILRFFARLASLSLGTKG